MKDLLTANQRLLQDAFGFTVEDLKANRKGNVSQNQRVKYAVYFKNNYNLYRTPLVAGGLIVIAVIFWAVVSLLSNSLQVGAMLCAGIPSAIGFALLMKGLRVKQDLTLIINIIQRGVVKGTITHVKKLPLTPKVDLEAKTVSQYPIQFGAEIINVDLNIYNAFEDDTNYIFYFIVPAPPSGAGGRYFNDVVACEKLQDALEEGIYITGATSLSRFKESQSNVEETSDVIIESSQPALDDPIVQHRPNEIFVSYTRKNLTFVQALVEEIKTLGVDPWFDMEDIPKTAEWWHEIKRGILKANAFIFIVSHGSLRSEVCNWELGYAIVNKKRIIPLMVDDAFKDPELSRLPPDDYVWTTPDNESVSLHHNWNHIRYINAIFALNGENLAKAAEEVVQSARTDFAHIDLHTRLLQRSLEWKQNGADFLLKGTELAAAEQWLTVSHDKEPQPTELQRKYIRQSRHNENERARIERLRERQAAQNENTVRQTLDATRQAQTELEKKLVHSEQSLAYYTHVRDYVVWGLVALCVMLGGFLISAVVNKPKERPSLLLVTPMYQDSLYLMYQFSQTTMSQTQATANAVRAIQRTNLPPEIRFTGEHSGTTSSSGEQKWMYLIPGAKTLTFSVLSTWAYEIQIRTLSGQVIETSYNAPLKAMFEANKIYWIVVSGEPNASYTLSIEK